MTESWFSYVTPQPHCTLANCKTKHWIKGHKLFNHVFGRTRFWRWDPRMHLLCTSCVCWRPFSSYAQGQTCNIAALVQAGSENMLTSAVKQVGWTAVQVDPLLEHACFQVIQGGTSPAKSPSKLCLSSATLLTERLQPVWLFYNWGMHSFMWGEGSILER